MTTKKQLLAQEVAKAVGAGKAVALETVDFNDPNRPKTCLEVDFPILPVNQVAIIEGNAARLVRNHYYANHQKKGAFKHLKKQPPPVNAEPMTRQFLRTFGSKPKLTSDLDQALVLIGANIDGSGIDDCG